MIKDTKQIRKKTADTNFGSWCRRLLLFGSSEWLGTCLCRINLLTFLTEQQINKRNATHDGWMRAEVNKCSKKLLPEPIVRNNM